MNPRTLLPLPPPILIIARALRGRCVLNKLPEDTDLKLDSVVLGDNSLGCTCFVDVACEGGLGIVELGLELHGTGTGVIWIVRADSGGSWVVMCKRGIMWTEKVVNWRAAEKV
jgi:hypothetical protein